MCSQMKTHRVRSGGRGVDLKHKRFCPCGVEVHLPPLTWMYAKTWKLAEARNFGIFMEVSTYWK